VQSWTKNVGPNALFFESGCPRKDSFIDWFNGKLPDELLNRENFDTLLKAHILIECWRVHYNIVQRHSSPAPEAVLSMHHSHKMITEQAVFSRGQCVVAFQSVSGSVRFLTPAAVCHLIRQALACYEEFT
jgi:hypothetical protein